MTLLLVGFGLAGLPVLDPLVPPGLLLVSFLAGAGSGADGARGLFRAAYRGDGQLNGWGGRDEGKEGGRGG